MAQFFRKETLMSTAVAPCPAVSSRVPLPARPRACWEHMVRRQPSPQRLVRRATMLLPREPGAHPCHGLRQRPRKRGTGQVGWRRGGARAPTREQRAAEEGRDQARTPVLGEAWTAAPRAGPPAPCTPDHIVQLVAVAWADPRDAGRPVRHGPPREGAEAGRQRRLVETSRPRRVGRV
jgi:hypothetical protein